MACVSKNCLNKVVGTTKNGGTENSLILNKLNAFPPISPTARREGEGWMIDGWSEDIGGNGGMLDAMVKISLQNGCPIRIFLAPDGREKTLG